MAPREDISAKIRHDLAARGFNPNDQFYAFVLESTEILNRSVAVLDDEIADITARVAWLAHAATWINRGEPVEFKAFVVEKFNQCESSFGIIRDRWLRDFNESSTNAADGSTQT